MCQYFLKDPSVFRLLTHRPLSMAGVHTFSMILIQSSISFKMWLSATESSPVNTLYIEQDYPGVIFSDIIRHIISLALHVCSRKKYFGSLDLID